MGMDEVLDDAKSIVKAAISVEGMKISLDLKVMLIDGMVNKIMDRLAELAADTATPLDDAVVAFLRPEIVKICESYVSEQMAKLVAA